MIFLTTFARTANKCGGHLKNVFECLYPVCVNWTQRGAVYCRALIQPLTLLSNYIFAALHRQLHWQQKFSLLAPMLVV